MKFLLVIVFLYLRLVLASRDKHGSDITLWIDEKQVKEFSGFPMEIFAIVDGVVLPYILDPNFENYLPVIPAEVESVNFTWRSGDQKYYYDFDQLKSFNESILRDPVVSIETRGKVPRKPRVFQVFITCRGNQSGVGSFGIGLRIQNDRGLFLPGTPLRLRLQKQCADHGPDPECDKKCANGGRCNQHRICECPKGYMGKYCHSALCYPQCMNGGTCVSPGLCACSDGYQGPHCEGGMCLEKCLNGGKCINKDTCECRRGYYGLRCEYSKCSAVPCLNGGRCVGINKCRCKKGYVGAQCEGLLDRPSLEKHGSRKLQEEMCSRSLPQQAMRL
ncbi:protein shifted-like isoform X3 [Stegodyphus dumicola]|uniref:protein shifted-like isoform X3 n=1 Tax=Stegodyphus dumicola TaxID=202533 RepID=UPI0015A90CA7|nr:protein shifted-like isoform X3 [Stegodyphus dumicola]XP_035213572.1 protein shifted-like isoform X3 [Stegodyphus dumicola]